MTAGHNTRHISNLSLPPVVLAALLAAALLGGAAIGASVAPLLGSTNTGTAIGGAAQPAPTFDWAGFQARENGIAERRDRLGGR